MNFTVRLKLLPSQAVYLSVSQMSGCPQMSDAAPHTEKLLNQVPFESVLNWLQFGQ
jgi:hypothetical protein